MMILQIIRMIFSSLLGRPPRSRVSVQTPEPVAVSET